MAGTAPSTSLHMSPMFAALTLCRCDMFTSPRTSQQSNIVLLFALYQKGVWNEVSQVSPCTAAAVARASTFRTFTEVLPPTALAVNTSGKHYAVLLACSLHEDISVSIDVSFKNGDNYLSVDVCTSAPSFAKHEAHIRWMHSRFRFQWPRLSSLFSGLPLPFSGLETGST